MKMLKKYLYLIVTSLVVSLMLILFTKPLVEKVTSGQQEIKSLTDNLQILTGKEEILNRFTDAYLSANINRLNLVLPSEKSIDGLMFTLDRLSREASVSVLTTSFNPGVVSSTSGTKKIGTGLIQSNKGEPMDVAINIFGQLENIKIFFDQLKRNLVAGKIGKVSLSRRKDNLVTASLTLTTYNKPVSMTLGEITSPLSPLTKNEENILSEIENLPMPVEISPLNNQPPTNRFNPFF